jgi:hypothetical protein
MTRHQPKLPRRTFLKGVGATLGLPVLNAMLPSNGWAAGAIGAPNRMAFVFVPNGVIVPDWTPKGEGADWQLSPTLEPLASVKDHLCVMTGLAQDNAEAKGDGPGDHARSAAAFLTGAHPVKTDGVDIKAGISVDQVAAEKIPLDAVKRMIELCLPLASYVVVDCGAGIDPFAIALRNDGSSLILVIRVTQLLK